MRYNVVKDASQILESSNYLVKNPANYKNKWKDVFGNKNPICLELGMGRGSFIIEMARLHPNVNYIGLELDQNQTEMKKKLKLNLAVMKISLQAKLFMTMAQMMLETYSTLMMNYKINI